MRRKAEGRTCPRGHWLYGTTTAANCYVCSTERRSRPKPRKVQKPTQRCRICPARIPVGPSELCRACEYAAVEKMPPPERPRPDPARVRPYIDMTITSTGRVVRHAIPRHLDKFLNKRRRRR